MEVKFVDSFAAVLIKLEESEDFVWMLPRHRELITTAIRAFITLEEIEEKLSAGPEERALFPRLMEKDVDGSGHTALEAWLSRS